MEPINPDNIYSVNVEAKISPKIKAKRTFNDFQGFGANLLEGRKKKIGNIKYSDMSNSYFPTALTAQNFLVSEQNIISRPFNVISNENKISSEIDFKPNFPMEEDLSYNTNTNNTNYYDKNSQSFRNNINRLKKIHYLKEKVNRNMSMYLKDSQSIEHGFSYDDCCDNK